MLLRWGLANLLHDRAGSLATLGGVALSLLVVLLVDGMFAGESQRIVAYLEQTPADVWVMQESVANMHMATSAMRLAVADEVRAIPGVGAVTPILHVNTFVEVGGRRWFSYVVGLPKDASRGGPWGRVVGRARPRPGEIVIPDVIARSTGTSLGDHATVFDRRLEIVGLAADTYSMANSVCFVAHRDLAAMLSAPGTASYLMVTAAPGVTAEALAARIEERVPGIDALPRATFVANDRRLAVQMGAELIRLMTWIGAALAALVVGFTAYASTIRRRREIGIAKALGVRGVSLCAVTVLQTLVVTLLGYGAAVGLAFGLRPAVEATMPAVALAYPVASVLRPLPLLLLVAALAALAPAWRIGRLDPSIVFRE
jgi:putative ABC transport system permease protein